MIPYKPIPVFNIGNIEIGSYAALIIITGIIGIFLAIKEAKRKRVYNKEFFYLIIWLIIGAYIGCRLFYYFGGFCYNGSLLNIFDIREGGAVFYGGFLGAVLAGFIYARVKKLNFWKTGDVLIPSAAIGLFIVRIGCFLHGCCYGIATQFPLAIYYVEKGIARHPTQLYESFFGLALFLVLILLKQKKRFDGFLFLMFTLFYSVFRFFIEFIRAEPKIFLSLTLSQWISIILFIVALILIWRKKDEKRS